jgi:hypothetical protein
VEKHLNILAQLRIVTRRKITSILLLCAGCTRASKSLAEALPVQVQAAWTLRGSKPLPAEEAPAVVRALGLKQAIHATYEGSGTIHLRVFEMNVEASAFELIQKWRQQDGLALYKGRYFFVAEGEGPDQSTVASFLQAFKREWSS